MSLRKIQYGMINAEVMDSSVTKIAGILRNYILSASDEQVRVNPDALKELIEVTRILTGKRFDLFLVGNYDNGLGQRSAIVRGIVLFLQGKISGRGLVQLIRTDESFVSWQDLETVKNTTATKTNKDYDQVIEGLRTVTQKDYYKLLIGVGPEYFARLFLTFMGETTCR